MDTLAPGCMKEAEYQHKCWDVQIPFGVNPDSLLAPPFWSLYAARLTSMDKIEARAQDKSWYGEYIVVDCARTWARVIPILGPVNLAAVKDVDDAKLSEELEKYDLKFRGPRLWSVVRKADSTIMTEDHAQRPNAEEWLKKHVKNELTKAA